MKLGLRVPTGVRQWFVRCLSASVIALLVLSAVPFASSPVPPVPVPAAGYAENQVVHSFGMTPSEARDRCASAVEEVGIELPDDQKESQIRLCTHYLGPGGGDQYSLLPLYRWQSWSSATLNRCGWFSAGCKTLNFIASLEYAFASFVWTAASSVMRLGLGGGIYNNSLVDWLYDRVTKSLFDNGLVFLVWGLLMLVFIWRVAGFGRRTEIEEVPWERTKMAFRDLGFGLLVILIMWLAYPQPPPENPAAPPTPSASSDECLRLTTGLNAIGEDSPGSDLWQSRDRQREAECREEQEKLAEAEAEIRANRAKNPTTGAGVHVPTSLKMTEVARAISSWGSWAGDMVAQEMADLSVSLRTDGSLESFAPTCSEYVSAMRSTSMIMRQAESDLVLSAPGTGGMVAVSALWETSYLPAWMESQYGETSSGVALASWCHVMESRNEISPDVQAELGRAAGYPALEPCPRGLPLQERTVGAPAGAAVLAGCSGSRGKYTAAGPQAEMLFLMSFRFNPNAENDEEKFINSRKLGDGELPGELGHVSTGPRRVSTRWTLYGEENSSGGVEAIRPPTADRDQELPTGLSYYGHRMCDAGKDREGCERGPYTRDMSDEELGLTTLMWDACLWDEKYDSFRPQVSWAWATDLHASQCEMWWHFGTLPGPSQSHSEYAMRSLTDSRNLEYLLAGRGWRIAELSDPQVPWGSGDNYMLDGTRCIGGIDNEILCHPSPQGVEIQSTDSNGESVTVSCEDRAGECDPRKVISLADRLSNKDDEWRTFMQSVNGDPDWRGHLNKTQAFLSVSELAARVPDSATAYDPEEHLVGRMTSLGDIGESVRAGTSDGSLGGSMGSVFVGLVTLITAVLYGLMLGGMGIGLIVAKFGALLLLSLSPFMLLAMAFPSERVKATGIKYFKTLVGYLVADILIVLMLQFVVLLLGMLTMIISWVSDSSWVLVLAPIIAIVVLWRISKKLDLGVNPFSVKGSLGLATGAAGAFRKDPGLLSRENLRSPEGRRAITQGVAREMRQGPHPRIEAGARSVQTATTVGAKRAGSGVAGKTGELTSKMSTGKWLESDSKAKRVLSRGWHKATHSPSQIGEFLSSSADKDLERWSAWKAEHQREMAARRNERRSQSGSGHEWEDRAREAGASGLHRLIERVDARRVRLELDPDRNPVVSGPLSKGLKRLAPPPEWSQDRSDKALEDFKSRALPSGASGTTDAVVRSAADYAVSAGPRLLSRIDRRAEHVSSRGSADHGEMDRLNTARSTVQDIITASQANLRRVEPMAEASDRLEQMVGIAAPAAESVIDKSAVQTKDRIVSKTLASSGPVYDQVMSNPQVGPQVREGFEELLASSGTMPREAAAAMFPYMGMLMEDRVPADEMATFMRTAREDESVLDAYYRRSVYEEALVAARDTRVEEDGGSRPRTEWESRDAAYQAAQAAAGYAASGLEDVHRKFADDMADQVVRMSFDADLPAVRSMLGVAEANATERYLTDFMADSGPDGQARMAQRMSMHEDLKETLVRHLKECLQQAEISAARADGLSREILSTLQRVPVDSRNMTEEVMRRLDGVSSRNEDLAAMGADGLRHMIGSLDRNAALTVLDESGQPVLTVDAYLRYLASLRRT